MAQLLFTTQDMAAAAEQMGTVAGDLLGRITALNAFGVLMPPALEVEVAETTASVAAAMTESSWFYAANAADLAERTALVLAEASGRSVGLRLGGWLSRWMSQIERASALRTIDWLAGKFGSDAYEGYERFNGGVGEVTGWLDTESFLIERTAISALEHSPAAEKEFMAELERIHGSGAYKAFGNVMNGLGALDGGYQAWQDTAGEVPVARALTAIGTSGADFAINRFPVTEGANFLDGGALQADANIGIQIVGGLISGGPKEAMKQWGNAAEEAANGQFGTPVKWVSEGVNWTVDKCYGPVSSALGHVSHTFSSAEHTVQHLASRGLKDLTSIF